MAYPTTFLDLQNAVINKMRLDSSADSQKVKDWLNQGYAQVCVETRFTRGSATASALTANQSTVTIPTSIVEIEEIVPAVSSVAYSPMIRISFRDMERRRSNMSGAQASPGAPFFYFVRQGSIEIWPNAAGGEVLTFWGIVLPTALSGDTDVPVIGEPYVKALEYYACSEASSFQRDPDFQTWRGLFEDELKRFRTFVQRRQSTVSPRLEMAGERPYVPHDPSTDLRDC